MFGSDIREQQVAVFEDTMEQLRSNKTLAALTEQAKSGTRLYMEGFRSKNRPEYKNTSISVIESRSFQAAKALTSELDRVAVLNFASGTNPGGGVRKGASAQEECLCRISNLYPCLTIRRLWEPFYQFHRDLPHKNYSDRIIYSKDITVFKTDTEWPSLMDDWYSVDVITSPAPNISGVVAPDWEFIKELFTGRIRSILETALDNGIEALVLGAFGCGAFRNPPLLVSQVFRNVLEADGYKEHFAKIVFAIIGTSNRSNENLNVFKRTFS